VVCAFRNVIRDGKPQDSPTCKDVVGHSLRHRRNSVVSLEPTAATRFPDQQQSTANLKTWQILLAGLFTLLGLSFAGSLMHHSPGVSTDDEIGHLVVCLGAWEHPSLILNLWARALYTLLYMIPARLGWTAARMFSLILATGTVVMATGAARKMGLRYFWLVPLLLWFQPFFGNWGFTTITEIPFTALFVAAALFFAYRRYSAAAFCVGLLPLIRYEGAALVAGVVLLAALKRQWKPIGFAILPLLVQNGISLLALGHLPFDMFLHPAEHWTNGQTVQVGSVASRFGISYRFRMLPDIAGIPVTILVVLGLPHLLKRKDQLVVFGGYLLYFSIHVVITWLGLYGELGGNARYLLPIAPALAMIAAVGLDSTVQALAAGAGDMGGRSAMAAARVGVISLCVLAVGISGVRNMAPLKESAEQIAMRKAADWVRTQNYSDRQIVSTNVWFYYLLPQAVTTQKLWVQTLDPKSLASGTIAVWDSQYSHSYGLPLSQLQDGSWRRVYDFSEPLAGNPAEHFEVSVFEKLGKEDSTTRPLSDINAFF
jgi:hypothetical protein